MVCFCHAGKRLTSSEQDGPHPGLGSPAGYRGGRGGTPFSGCEPGHSRAGAPTPRGRGGVLFCKLTASTKLHKRRPPARAPPAHLPGSAWRLAGAGHRPPGPPGPTPPSAGLQGQVHAGSRSAPGSPRREPRAAWRSGRAGARTRVHLPGRAEAWRAAAGGGRTMARGWAGARLPRWRRAL